MDNMTMTGTANTGQPDSDMIGAINPYALAEVVAGRSIDWARTGNSRTVLEDILQTSYEKLFDPVHDSPLYLGVRLTEDNVLERARPAVLDVKVPQGGSDLDQRLLVDTGHLKKVGDLGPLFGAKDVADIPIDSAELVEPGVLRLRLTDATESRLARLARVLTPEIVMSTTLVPDMEIPDTITSEPSVSYWGDYGRYFNEAAEFFDPVQGAVPNCYLIAAMSAVAWAQPYRIRHQTRATGAGQHQFVNNIRLYHMDTHVPTDVEVTDRIPLRHSNNKPLYARSSEDGETWPAILEKAYAKWESGASGDKPNIPSTAYGAPTRACAEITGLTPFSVKTAENSADDLWSLVRKHSLSRRTFDPMCACTYSTGAKSPDKVVYADANLAANHCYTVLGWDYRDGKKYIILRNPWGHTEVTVGSLAGTVHMYDVSWWRPIELAKSDGTFGLEVGVFKKYFSKLGGVE